MPDASTSGAGQCKLVELRVEPLYFSVNEYHEHFEYMSGMSRALNEKLAASKKLTRLDLRGLPPLLGADEMNLLLTFVASPSCSIHDLGLCSFSDRLCIAAYSNSFLKAFESGSSLSKLKALRFSGVRTKEAAACVVEALACPATSCKVRFIDIQVAGFNHIDVIFQHLQQARARIEGLRITYLYVDSDSPADAYTGGVSNLSQFLGWANCSLLWLQCMCLPAGRALERCPLAVAERYPLPEPLQLEMANALENNSLITSLHLPFTSPAARSRAAAFLARNRLYQSMGFSPIKEGVKPQVGRLFVCGHGEVGKTTLCKALLKLQSQRRPATSNSIQPPTAFFNRMLQMCRSRCTTANPHEPRTRGIEIRQLCLQPSQSKLVIFDLGGQQDYHVFHHYMVANTSHDLFIVVCKFINEPASQPSKLKDELEYWLKFIVSHRNSVHGPNPKVMLVVNFFGTPTRPLSDMKETAEDITAGLREKYAQQYVDFGDAGGDGLHDQVHGIVARMTSQAKPILAKLEVLLQELLDRRPMIPKLCNDLLSHTLPQLVAGDPQKKLATCAGYTGVPFQCQKAPAKKVIVAYAHMKEHFMQQQHPIPTGREFFMLEKKLQAALVELHNVGAVVFFPPPKQAKSRPELGDNVNAPLSSNSEVLQVASASSSSLAEDMASTCVITNPDWFCNKIVGSLLAPLKFGGKSVWNIIDLRQHIKDSGCPKQYVEAILRYMQSSEFCYAINDVDKTEFFFPAIADVNSRSIHRPAIFNKGNTNFYGRRIKCKETDTHLIPSGVFARLQVRLQNSSIVDNDPSYKMGYHWVSFVKDTIGVMVRFGRIANDHRDQSQSTTVSIIMEEDDHPEWIDILLCSPSSDNAPQQAPSKEHTIMHDIKKHLFNICQATSKGIPTVKFEDLVLRHEAHKDARLLVEVQDCAHKGGLQSHITWQSQESTPIVDLMLPEELKDYVISHVQALQQIKEEFGAGTLEEEKDAQFRKEEGGDLYKQLPEELKVLYDLLYLNISRHFERLDAKMDSVLAIVKEVKKDVGKVMDSLQKAQLNIVANCSTRLLRQLAQGVLPSYPYLTNSYGQMQKIKSLLQKTAKVHFLCESHGCPHVVEGQLGKDVVVERGILMKMAPFLVPALKIMCCAARCAANAYLPGVAPLIFGAFTEFLKPIGITEQDLQSEIMPMALNAIFDGLDVKIQDLFDSKAEIREDHEGQQTRQEAVEAIQRMLGSMELDMERDFGLHLVRVGENQAEWLCKDHANGHTKFSPQPRNPFAGAK